VRADVPEVAFWIAAGEDAAAAVLLLDLYDDFRDCRLYSGLSSHVPSADLSISARLTGMRIYRPFDQRSAKLR
jgi:hypothetical protein